MIDNMLDPGERVLWRGVPHRGLYVLGSVGLLVFAAIWGAFDFFFIRVMKFGMMGAPGFGAAGGMTFFMIPFFALHLMPVWIAVFGILYRALAYHNVEYVITDKRVYCASGLFGVDVVSVEHREISDLAVDVNPLEKLAGVGTIRLTPDVARGSGKNRRVSHGHRLKHIEDPYEVFRQLKQVSLDIYTDQQYPNQYRPSENPGYRTTYKK